MDTTTEKSYKSILVLFGVSGMYAIAQILLYRARAHHRGGWLDSDFLVIVLPAVTAFLSYLIALSNIVVFGKKSVLKVVLFSMFLTGISFLFAMIVSLNRYGS